MTRQIAGKIFLAEQRGVFETPRFRRFSTLNFGDYSNPCKVPLGSLSVVNEESLASAHRVVLDVAESSHILLVPITGEVHFTDGEGIVSAVDVGQVLVATLLEGTTFQLANPYGAEIISYLQIWVKATGPLPEAALQILNFDSGSIRNRLAEIVPYPSGNAVSMADYPFSLSLGCFAGREEATYPVHKPKALFFGVVVSGAFEVGGRLLHQNDGLALWNTPDVELEALSENAVILVMEIWDFIGAN